MKGSEKRFVSMDTPNKKEPLMTKCEMYDKDNNRTHCYSGVMI